MKHPFTLQPMRAICLLSSVLAMGFLFGTPVVAQDAKPETTKPEAAKAKKPKPEPVLPGEVTSRVILTWDGDPARTQHVSWRTDALQTVAKAEIAPFTADPSFPDKASSIGAIITRIDLPEGKTSGQYSADFAGLNPDSEYCYRVGNGHGWSEWSTFHTAKTDAAPFRFIYIGDAQNNIKSMWSRAIRTAYKNAPKARFVAMAGDLIAEGWDDRLWGELTDGFSFISATMPIVPVPGNHDINAAPGQPKSYKTSPLWKAHFGLPQNGPKDVTELDQQTYFMDYQGVRFIALDANVFEKTGSNDPDRLRIRDAQVKWMEATLKNNPNKWTIVMQHQGPYSIASDRDYPEIQTMLAPLYEKYKVALVLLGHDHSYGRVKKNGVTYVTSVSGPKMYELKSKWVETMDKTATHIQMYQVVDVNPQRIALKAFAIDGKLVDSVEIPQSN